MRRNSNKYFKVYCNNFYTNQYLRDANDELILLLYDEKIIEGYHYDELVRHRNSIGTTYFVELNIDTLIDIFDLNTLCQIKELGGLLPIFNHNQLEYIEKYIKKIKELFYGKEDIRQ